MKQATYKIEEFTVEQINNKKMFTVPRFQRGISWNKEKRKNFIKTVREGKPFGTILIFKKNNNSTLVDGLQRIAALEDYDKHFINYIPNLINEDIVEKIYSLSIKLENEDYERVTKYRIKELQDYIIKIFEENNEITTDFFYKKIKNHFGFQKSEDEWLNIIGEIEKLIKDFNSKRDINNFKVPAIIYEGDENDLPEIFERINTGSVILSKYEVLAATWLKHTFTTNDSDIKNAIKNKYETLRDNSNINLDFNIDDIDKEINFFEYCYALGILLHNKAPLIFGKGNSPDKADSLGFDILCLISDIKLNNTAKLPEIIKDFKQTNFLEQLKDVILESASKIQEILEPWLTTPNSNEAKLKLWNNNYMFFHIFISYIRMNYSIDFNSYKIESVSNKKYEKIKFKQYLPAWLLYNIISKFWEKNRQILDLYRLSTSKNDLNKYTEWIGEKNWEDAIYTWIKGQNEREKLENISTENKFFLNFIHKINLQKEQAYFDAFNNKNMDIEHIIPKKRLENIKNEIPISSISNLCYFSRTMNRTKQESTLYEYIDSKSELGQNENLNLLKIISYPEREAFNFLNLNPNDKKIQYINFMKNRTSLLAQEFSKKIEYFFNS